MTPKIIASLKDKIKPQDYTKKTPIEGVKIVDLKNFVSEDGYLSELGRLDDEGNIKGLNNFKMRQINFTKVLPGTIKAWHLHFNQDDLWFVPPDGHLTIGLVDIRDDSPTKEVKMKFVVGSGKSQLVYIPSGVAHGYVNNTMESQYVFYFVNQEFDIDNPDEKRLPWDVFGEGFWKVKPG